MKVIEEKNFYCTGGNKQDDAPTPISFEVTKSGFKKIYCKINDDEARSFAAAFNEGNLKYGVTGLGLTTGYTIAKSGGFYGKE